MNELPDWMAAALELRGLDDLEAVRWINRDGEFVVGRSDLPLPLFGEHPELVRVATFIFGSGARVTVDFSEASPS